MSFVVRILLISSFVSVLNVADARAQSFAVGQQLPAPIHPNSVAIADLNGDGHLDLAVPSYSPSTLAIYLGDGAGGFGAAVTFAAGSGPRSVSVADFNSDGKLDAAVANQDSGDVSIFIGDGMGGMLQVRRIATGSLVYHLTTGDVNADGRADIVVANSGADNVSVLLGDGTGNFTSAGLVPTGPTPRASVLADFNGDSKLDLAVSNWGADYVLVYPGNGLGGFGSPVTVTTGGGPFTLLAKDLNADGRVDLIVPNFGANTLSVALGDGSGGFGVPTNISVGLAPRAVVSADFDNDGAPDLAVANRDSSTVSILRNNGAAQFVVKGVYGVGSGPFSLATADLTGDGLLDLAVADRDGHTVSIVRGESLAKFTAPRAFAVGRAPRGVTIADVDGDGHADVLTANLTDNKLSFQKGQGDGTLGAAVNVAVGKSPYASVAGDFNGDGQLDVATANGSSNNVSVLRNNGAGGFLAALNTSVGGGPRAIVSGHFNGDVRLDVATANFNHNTASVLLGNGAGGFAAPLLLATGSGPSGIATADFNGDLRPDLAVSNATSNNVSVFLATGPGTFGSPASFAGGTGPAGIVAVDLDGDDIVDLAMANEWSNDVRVLKGNGAGGFSALATLAAGVRPIGIASGDVSGDGLADLVVANSTSNTLTVFRSLGGGSFAPAVTLPAGVLARAVAMGDLDGDGQADLAVVNGSGNDVWTLLNRSGSLADLGTVVSNSAGVVHAGATVSYVVTVSNNGPSSVSAVTLTLSVPAALLGVTLTPSSGTYDFSSGTWTGLNLAPGNSETLTIAATLSASASGTVRVAASVAAPSGTVDANGGNNGAEDIDSIIVGYANLQVSVSNATSEVTAGDPVSYTIVAGNAGPTAVSGARLTALIPGSLNALTWTCTASGGAVCPPSGAGVPDVLVSLPVGGVATLHLSGTIDPAAPSGTLVVTASLTAPADILETDPADNLAVDIDALHGNSAPVANAQAVTVTEDQVLAITLTGSDLDSGPLTYTIVASPAHGTLSGTAPDVTYTPVPNYSGPDSFMFRVHDGLSPSASATVAITVTPVNDQPTVTPQSIATNEDVPALVNFAGLDADGDALTYTPSAPAHGTLSGTGTTRTYTPAANYSGPDSFTVVAFDGQLSSLPVTISITVHAANDAPTVAAPIVDMTINGEATSASVSLGSVFTDVESPAALTVTATSSDPTLAVPTVVGSTLDLALAANRGGSAVVTVRATDPSGAWVEDSFVVSVVRPGARVSVGDASRGEGSPAGLTFTISLAAPSTVPVTVAYATTDGSATAGQDYAPVAGTVTFAVGATTRTVSVSTVADILDEDDETVNLVLSSPVGAVIDDGVGVGTIVDNDTSSLTVADLAVIEGNGTSVATFSIALSTPSSRNVTVNFSTVPVSASAVAGVDYTATSGVVSFPIGSTAPQTVTVTLLGDLLDEANEAFSLSLTNAVNATIGRALARATIVDDDDPPSVSIGNASTTEGHSGLKSFVFSVTLSGASGLSTRVRYQTVDGTAVAGSDYTARSGELVFAPGVTSLTVTISVGGDTVVEGTETFSVQLHTPTSLVIGSGQGVGTIVEDDGA